MGKGEEEVMREGRERRRWENPQGVAGRAKPKGGKVLRWSD